MTDKEFTAGQKEWLKRRTAARQNEPNAHAYFNNIALTVDGVLCVGMSYSRDWRYFGCTYTMNDDGSINRETGSHRWDIEGGALTDCADLNLKSISDGIYKY